jgi:hypothetical protein
MDHIQTIIPKLKIQSFRNISVTVADDEINDQLVHPSSFSYPGRLFLIQTSQNSQKSLFSAFLNAIDIEFMKYHNKEYDKIPYKETGKVIDGPIKQGLIFRCV